MDGSNSYFYAPNTEDPLLPPVLGYGGDMEVYSQGAIATLSIGGQKDKVCVCGGGDN